MMLVLLEIEVQTFYDGCCLDFFFCNSINGSDWHLSKIILSNVSFRFINETFVSQSTSRNIFSSMLKCNFR